MLPAPARPFPTWKGPFHFYSFFFFFKKKKIKKKFKISPKPIQNPQFYHFCFTSFPPNSPSLSPSTPKSSHRRPPRTTRYRSELCLSSGSGDQFRTSTVDHCLLPSPSPSPATRYCQVPSPTTHTQPPAVF
jgi:hypothetical protein